MKLNISNNLTIKGLIEAGKYNHIDFIVPMHFYQTPGDLRLFFKDVDEEVEVEVIDVEGVSLEKVEIPKGYRTPTFVEALSFGKQYPEEQLKGSIFSKTFFRDGKNSANGIALREHKGERYLTCISWHCEKIPAGSRMLVVKNAG